MTSRFGRVLCVSLPGEQVGTVYLLEVKSQNTRFLRMNVADETRDDTTKNKENKC